MHVGGIIRPGCARGGERRRGGRRRVQAQHRRPGTPAVRERSVSSVTSTAGAASSSIQARRSVG